MSQHTSAADATDPEPTVRATVEAGPFRAALDAVDALVEECVLHAGPDGVAVDAQDPATVALVSLDLPADAFEHYEADGTPLGVDLGRLGDVAGMADRDGTVRMAYDAETRTLDLRVDELAYTLGLVDPDAIRSAPDVDYEDHLTATVTIQGHEFAHAVRATDMVADHCALGVAPDEKHLYAAAEGDVDSVRIEHPAEDCETFEAADAHSLFSTTYLDAMARVVPDDELVRLRLGEEAPLELSFDLAGGSVTYYLAPRRVVQ
jgi:proliferating cell nuclear antigen